MGGINNRGFLGFGRGGFKDAGGFKVGNVDGLGFWGLDTSGGVASGVTYVNGTARLDTNENGVTPRQDEPGRCYYFNALYQTAVGGLATPAFPFTLCTWFNRDNVTGGNQGLISLCDFDDAQDYLVVMSDNATIELQWRDGTGTTVANTGNIVSAATWHHVALVANSTTSFDVYLDGAFVQTFTVTARSVGDMDCVVFGGFRNTTSSNYLDGYGFDGCYFTDALTASEIAGIAAMSSPGTADGVPADNLAVRFKADEGGGLVSMDSSGNDNHGTITNVAMHSSDGSNDRRSAQNADGYTQVATFDGGSDYVSVADHADFDITDHLSVFVRCQNDNALLASGECVISKYKSTGNLREWQLGVSSGEELRLQLGDPADGSFEATVDSSSSINPDEIKSIGFTFDGGTVVLYVDGVAVASSTTSGAVPSTLFNGSQGVMVGALETSAPSQHWAGIIHDARIYHGTASSVLSAAQILEIHQSGTTAFADQDLVARWQLGEGANLTAIDRGDNGIHHGTITGPTESEVWARKLPIDTSDSTKDIAGGPAQYTGSSGHAPVLTSPCIQFDGSTEYATVSDNTALDMTDHVTWAFWCQNDIASLSAAEVLLEKYETTTNEREFQILFNSSDELRLNLGTSGGSASGDWIDDNAVADLTEPMYIVITFNGGVVRAYINGIERTGTSTGLPSTINNETSDMLIGAGLPSTPANHWDGKIWDVRIYEGASDVPTPTEVLDMYENGTRTISGQTLKAGYPLLENFGAFGHDISGNNNHATITGGTWSTQNTYDDAVTSGIAVATNYSGTGEYMSRASRVTSGALTNLSVGCWLWMDSLATLHILGEEETTGSEKVWSMLADVSGKLRFSVSNDGSAEQIETSTPTYAVNTWYHFAAVYDGAAQTITLYVDGAAIASTNSGTPPTSLNDGTCSFEIGATDGGLVPFNGRLSGVVVEEASWSAATVAQIYAGIVPSTAWFWKHGNQYEHNQGLADLTVNGTPDRIHIPNGAELPKTIGPNKLVDSQVLDLGAGEANSPYAQQLNAIITDLSYTRGDGEEADALFVREDDANGCDDRIITVVPAATGTELTNLDNYTANIS